MNGLGRKLIHLSLMTDYCGMSNGEVNNETLFEIKLNALRHSAVPCSIFYGSNRPENRVSCSRQYRVEIQGSIGWTLGIRTTDQPLSLTPL